MASIEITKQQDERDCGLHVLQAIHRHYFGKTLNINQLKMDVNFDAKGISVDQLITIGRRYGIIMDAYEVNFEDLVASNNKGLFVSLIIRDGLWHYVIIRRKGHKLEVYDSQNGKEVLDFIHFRNWYQNIVITISRGLYTKDTLVEGQGIWLFALKSWPSTCITIIIIDVLVAILSIVCGMYMRIIVDNVLPSRAMSALTSVAIAFALIIIVRLIATSFRGFARKRLENACAAELRNIYLDRLIKVEISDLTRLTFEDHLRRLGALDTLAGFLTSFPFIVATDAFVLLVTTIAMFTISSLLAIVVIAFGCALAFVASIMRIGINSDCQKMTDAQLQNMTSLITFVKSNSSLKDHSLVNLLLTNGNKHYDYAKRTEWIVWRKTTIQNMATTTLEIMVPLAITWIGGRFVLNNHLSLGTLMMFTSVAILFISPTSNVASFVVSLPQQRNIMRMFEVVFQMKTEEINDKGLQINKITQITLENIQFGYNRPLFHIPKLVIDSSLHIEGPNGIGKSTLLKIIATLIRGEGEITFNEYNSRVCNLSSIRNRILHITSSPTFPECTIIDFITCGSTKMRDTFFANVQRYNLIRLLTMAQIDLTKKVHRNGDFLSYGQKQIINIMQFFARDVDVVLLDETFEHIDITSFTFLCAVLRSIANKIFVEISHTKRYLSNESKTVNIAQFVI